MTMHFRGNLYDGLRIFVLVTEMLPKTVALVSCSI